MKNSLRKFYVSFIFTSCIVFGFLAVCVAYENIRATEYGDNRRAIAVEDGKFYFFDYEYEFKKQNQDEIIRLGFLLISIF